MIGAGGNKTGKAEETAAGWSCDRGSVNKGRTKTVVRQTEGKNLRLLDLG